MATDNSNREFGLSHIEREQVADLLGEIASKADILNSLLLTLSENETSSAFHAVYPIVAQIGYMADLGADKAGGIMVNGGAEKWFLPPCYFWHAEKKEEIA